MEQGQSVQLEPIFRYLSIGIAILNSADLSIRYVNPYLLSLLASRWREEEIVGRVIQDVLPEELQRLALPALREVSATGKSLQWADLPYEGFLATRGRTYWQVSIQRIEEFTAGDFQKSQSGHAEESLLVTIEDVTELARSRLYVDAIQRISSSIGSQFALSNVLDRVLQAVQEMVGSTRCAILLIDRSESDSAWQRPLTRERAYFEEQRSAKGPPTVTIAAQKGVHIRSQDWHPQLSEQILLGRAIHYQQTIVITDANKYPDIVFPQLDDEGTPRRPGSALCIPIFDPTGYAAGSPERLHWREMFSTSLDKGRVLGAIEIYHRRARGFPAEEVALLEQFAVQAGLAIQNTRLFQWVNQLADDAHRNLRQREYIMQAIPDGVIIYDARWRVVDTNEAIRHLLGWTEEIVGLHISQALKRSAAVFPEDFKALPEYLAKIDTRESSSIRDEFKLIAADGSEHTMRRSFAPIRDELGSIFAYVSLYHDVTEQVAARERIEAEVKVRTAELAQRNLALELAKAAQELESARMELLLKRLPSGVMLVSADDCRINIINSHAVNILQSIGLPLPPEDDPEQAAQQAVGRNAEALLQIPNVYAATGVSLPYDERPFALAVHQGVASEAELHMLQTDGQMLYLLASAAPLKASDGSITNVVLVLHEITNLKMLERAREDFFTTMAHELKTPLANVRAHLSALQASDLQWSAEKQLEFLSNADEQVERLVGMINHFLDASRVEAGALRLELEPILLPEMMEDVKDRLEALIANSGRRLEMDLPPALPAVIGDYELIMSVLINLLSNAFRYAPEGDTVQIEIEPILAPGSEHPSSVEIRVKDRGPGMTQEQQRALFTRFSTFAAMNRPSVNRPGQPTEERRRGSGRWSPATGLGLYISRGIVEAHGSTLRVQSSPGEGASFAFTLAIASPLHDKEEMG
jgi:PAS domain S-box-containing protein